MKRGDGGLKIIYEDAGLLVINKPAGLLSVATESDQRTAYRLATEHVRRRDSRARIFIVHRLDRDTSGVLLFAKDQQLKLALQESWNSLVTLRGYTAVAEGRMPEGGGRIRTWLKETKTHVVYSSRTPGDGLEAITDYTTLALSRGYSLLDVRLETGRKNQIRVHLKELGHPVAGDKKYGAATDPLRRLGLHARALELAHPLTGEKLLFEAPAPEAFTAMFRPAKK